jgi:type IV secretory pathway VirB10-like protein
MIEMKDQIESPAGLDLNPSPPPTARISRKVGLVGIGVVVLVGILVVYGLYTRKQQQAVARAVNEQKHPEPAHIAGDQVVREIAPRSVANPAPAPAGVPESGAPVNDPAISGPTLRPQLEITRRNLNIQPTIKIREGYKFNVRVNRDMLFDAPSSPAEMR